VVIVVCVSAVGLGVGGRFLEPVQKRVHPIIFSVCTIVVTIAVCLVTQKC